MPHLRSSRPRSRAPGPPRVLVLLLLVVPWPSPWPGPGLARADAPAGQVEEARLLYQEAEALRRAGQPAAALLRYRRAYELVPTPMILLSQAEAYRDLNRTQDALAVLKKLDEQGLPEAERQRVCVLRAALFSLSSWPAELRPWSGDPFLSLPLLAPGSRAARPAGPDRLAQSLGWSKWATGAAGLTLMAVGGTLWGVAMGPGPGQGQAQDMRAAPAGMVLLGAGISGLTLSALFFGLDASRASRTSREP